jgi:hypothetical protein
LRQFAKTNFLVLATALISEFVASQVSQGSVCCPGDVFRGLRFSAIPFLKTLFKSVHADFAADAEWALGVAE